MSEGEERLKAEGSALHGRRGDPRWPAPRLAASSEQANRADQGNMIKAHEYLDDPEVLDAKLDLVADLVRQSQCLIAYTGAGLSKASGIPDYATKATNSVVNAPKLSSSFDAQPTYAHHVLTALERAGYLKEYVQQNHDGLPQKAGFPQGKMNEIHGAWYDPSNPVVKFSGTLRHDLFEWMLDLEQRADLCLCLGTSLSGMNADRMATSPAARSLLDPPEALGTVIVNLQRTHLDGDCAVRVWARLDEAFALLAEKLGVEVRPLELSLPPGDVFPVPYDAEGKLDMGSVMQWDLRTGQAVKIAVPEACNVGVEGTVLGKDREGNYVVAADLRRRLGRWWVEAALRGEVPRLPLVNVEPRVRRVPAEPLLADVASLQPEDDEYRPLEVAPDSPAGEASTPAPALPATLTLVQSHHRVEPAEASSNQHAWSLELAPGSERWVEGVTWILHPTFRCPRVECGTPPFRLERLGWGTFDVGVEVRLKAGYGKRVLEASHTLSFSESGDAVATSVVPTS